VCESIDLYTGIGADQSLAPANRPITILLQVRVGASLFRSRKRATSDYFPKREMNAIFANVILDGVVSWNLEEMFLSRRYIRPKCIVDALSSEQKRRREV
jgi:hypothetical protein